MFQEFFYKYFVTKFVQTVSQETTEKILDDWIHTQIDVEFDKRNSYIY